MAKRVVLLIDGSLWKIRLERRLFESCWPNKSTLTYELVVSVAVAAAVVALLSGLSNSLTETSSNWVGKLVWLEIKFNSQIGSTWGAKLDDLAQTTTSHTAAKFNLTYLLQNSNNNNDDDDDDSNYTTSDGHATRRHKQTLRRQPTLKLLLNCVQNLNLEFNFIGATSNIYIILRTCPLTYLHLSKTKLLCEFLAKRTNRFYARNKRLNFINCLHSNLKAP